MTRPDDFSTPTKLALAKRVGFKCSNPKCKRPTSGPAFDSSNGTASIGVAAHISAASSGGARFDPVMPSSLRSSIDNAIWCCQNCAKLIDDDETTFTIATLKNWKNLSEHEAASDLERRNEEQIVRITDEEIFAQQDILLGALEGHEGNMIVFGERNGWDVVTIIGENYCSNQDERSLYVEAMLQLIADGLVRRRGLGIAYELTYSGLKKAKSLRTAGGKRRKPGTVPISS